MALPKLTTDAALKPTGTPPVASAYNDRLQTVPDVVKATGGAVNLAGATTGYPKDSLALGTNPTPGNTNLPTLPKLSGGTSNITIAGVWSENLPPWTNYVPLIIAIGVFLYIEYR